MSLFIGRLPLDDFDARDLRDMFEVYGKIEDYNMKYGTKYGYGFVTYEDPKNMTEAIRKEDGRYIDGRRIIVERAIRDMDARFCFNCGRRGHKEYECRNTTKSSERYDYYYDRRGRSYSDNSTRYDDENERGSRRDNSYERSRRNDSYERNKRRRHSDDKYYNSNRSRRGDDDERFYCSKRESRSPSLVNDKKEVEF